MGFPKLRAHRKKLFVLMLLTVVVVAVFLFFRGPYVSNLLKMAVLPRVQEATGKHVIAQKIILNLFPLYVEARNVRAFDEKGARIFAAERIKGYLGLSGILHRQVTINRVVFENPQLRADAAMIREIRGKAGEPRAGAPNMVRITVRSVVLKDGELLFHDEEAGFSFAARGLNAEFAVKERPQVRFTVREAAPSFRNWPAVKAGIEGQAEISEGRVDFQSLRVSSLGSRLSGRGFIAAGPRAEFTFGLELPVETVKSIFKLEETGKGSVFANGEFRIEGDVKNPILDFGLRGDFHLETLMEILKVKKEFGLAGHVDFEGRLGGPISDLAGEARATIDRSAFFGVKLDHASCRVLYGDRKLSFKEGNAHLYGGEAMVEVSIGIPVVKPFSVDVAFRGVDSGPAFALIGLEELRLARGKVEGELHSFGDGFEPVGWAVYGASQMGEDVLGRVKTLSGNFKKIGNEVILSGFKAKTDASTLSFEGTVDGGQRKLDIRGRVITSNIGDLAAPYVTGLSGEGQFEASVSDTFDDPLIKGDLKLWHSSYRGYPLGEVEGGFSLRKSVLRVERVVAEQGPGRNTVEGVVRFPGAEKFFDMQKSAFDLRATAEGGDVRRLIAMLGFEADVDGMFDSEFRVLDRGPLPSFQGSARVLGAKVYGRKVSEGTFGFLYGKGEFSIRDASFREGDSSVSFHGRVGKGGIFEFEASSERVMLNDLLARKMPIESKIKFYAAGMGTLDEPDIRADVQLYEGRFMEMDIGGAWARASLLGKELAVEASAVEDAISLKGKALLEDEFPWSAEVNIAQGRYDFLIGAFLKKIPDDLLFSMSGAASFRGDRKNLNGSALISRLNLNLFGQGFTNPSDLTISIVDNRISLQGVKLRSGSTYVSVDGGVTLGSSYDLTISGRSSLAPVGGMVDSIESIGGSAEFVFSLQGDWKRPSLDGGISVSEGFLAVKGFPHRLSSINLFLYVDDEKAVIRKAEAKLGGGNVEADGVINLKGLEMEKVFINALLDNVSLIISGGFTMNLGGRMLLAGNQESRDISGELQINRAVYRERVDWKSWLLTRRKRAPKAEEAWADKTALNVRVSGSENIKVDNNIANALLSVDMVIGGTLASPVLYGRVESTEGKVFFRNSDFRIVTATADFVDPEGEGPILKILAETSVKGYHVWLNLDGRMQQFDLSLSSDPPLDEVQILGLLTVGEFGQGLSGMESGIGAAEATSFLTGKIQDVFEERFRDITGLDRFQIDPYVSESTGEITPRITVSKRLLGERLYVTYSSAMGDTVEDELKLEYLLGDNVSLLGGQDVTGGIGGDLKFRFRFK